MSPDLESNTRALAGLPSPCVRATVKLLLDWKALSQGKSEQSVCGGGGQDRGWDRRQERRDQGAGGCEQRPLFPSSCTAHDPLGRIRDGAAGCWVLLKYQVPTVS